MMIIKELKILFIFLMFNRIGGIMVEIIYLGFLDLS